VGHNVTLRRISQAVKFCFPINDGKPGSQQGRFGFLLGGNETTEAAFLISDLHLYGFDLLSDGLM